MLLESNNKNKTNSNNKYLILNKTKQDIKGYSLIWSLNTFNTSKQCITVFLWQFALNGDRRWCKITNIIHKQFLKVNKLVSNVKHKFKKVPCYVRQFHTNTSNTLLPPKPILTINELLPKNFLTIQQIVMEIMNFQSKPFIKIFINYSHKKTI